jgi:hypothetical protein
MLRVPPGEAAHFISALQDAEMLAAVFTKRS